MKLHVWLLLSCFLIAQIRGGAMPSARGEAPHGGHAKSCGMSCCKFVDEMEACGCMDSPTAPPAGSQPMQTAPSASCVPQPLVTATLLTDVVSPRASIVINAPGWPSAPSCKAESRIGLPVLFCSFLI